MHGESDIRGACAFVAYFVHTSVERVAPRLPATPQRWWGAGYTRAHIPVPVARCGAGGWRAGAEFKTARRFRTVSEVPCAFTPILTEDLDSLD